MLEELKKRVCEANLELQRSGIVFHTWGNVSEIDRKTGLIVIKPSGIEYDSMTPDDMAVVDFHTGEKVEGRYRPSTDTPTHLELYRAFPAIGGIAHTHSTFAVAFAQAGIDIPAIGTTHADHYYGNVPSTRVLTEEEVMGSYEENTGKVIVSCFTEKRLDPMQVPGVLVKNHGPFTWGRDAHDAVFNAVVLERVAKMNLLTLLLNPNASMPEYILDKHYYRKHGSKAYYGQVEDGFK